MTNTLSRGAAALALAAALAACGGGGGGGGTPAGAGGDAAGAPPAGGSAGTTPPATSTAAVPDSALGSWPAMLAFLKAFVADENGEPLALPGPAPLDDGGEPSPTS